MPELSAAPEEGADPISDYLAITTAGAVGSGPVSPTGGGEVARAQAGLRELTHQNARTRSRQVFVGELPSRIVRITLSIGFVACFSWVVLGNVLGHATATTTERPVTIDTSGIIKAAAVELPDGTTARADCWGSSANATVWEAPPPFKQAIPYRCGDSTLAAMVSGPISAGALVLGTGCALALIASEIRRRRRANWY